MSLNTEIFGDPEGCRATGQWLRTLGEGVLDSAVLLHQISVNSEWCWNDRVGYLFRERIAAGRRDAEFLSDEVKRMGDAVNNLADDLDDARATMRDARLVAELARLPLTPTTIEPPVVPAAMTDNTPSIHIEEIVEESRAREAFAAQVEAYEEATTVVEGPLAGARGPRHPRAEDPGAAGLAGRDQGSYFLHLVNAAVDEAATTYRQSTTWAAIAEDHRGFAQQSRQLLDNPRLTQSARDAALHDFLVQQGQSARATRAAASNSRISAAWPTPPGAGTR